MRKLAKFRAVAGLALAALTVSAFAFFEQEIIIDKALNSPTFTVKYSGAAAAMVELRVNGVSLGTRAVSPAKTTGTVDFTIDLSGLSDGDNLVEVRLFDKNGKLVGTQRATIQSEDDDSKAPVRMAAPKMGSTVKGPVEIKVGFGKEMRNSYVSFFVDEQFKAMTNVSPYTFMWDTTLEPNGWHELQAWIVDDNSTTFKTRKVRVFVNNPGGRTERVLPTTPVGVGVKPPVTKPVPTTVKAAATAVKTVKTVAPATPALNLQPVMSGVTAITSNTAGLKRPSTPAGLTTTARMVTPKLVTALPTKINVEAPTAKAPAHIEIKKGAKLPDLETFVVLMDGKKIDFDVAPRFLDGVPIAPLRHLFEHDGGKVDWEHVSKTVKAEVNGKSIMVKIGDKWANINDIQVEMEIKPFLEKGRTIIPLTFLRDTLEVNVNYDPATGHVLITSVKSKK